MKKHTMWILLTFLIGVPTAFATQFLGYEQVKNLRSCTNRLGPPPKKGLICNKAKLNGKYEHKRTEYKKARCLAQNTKGVWYNATYCSILKWKLVKKVKKKKIWECTWESVSEEKQVNYKIDPGGASRPTSNSRICNELKSKWRKKHPLPRKN